MRIVNTATAEGPHAVEARVFNLDFNGGKIACFVQKGSKMLSHFASGRAMVGLAVVDQMKYPLRDCAQYALDRLVEKEGVDAILEAFSAAPTLNTQGDSDGTA